jgi:hypothetical protein
MRTRSQTKQKEYEVSIDFDEASALWNANKKKLKNGCYEYVCGKDLGNGCFCKKKIRTSQFCYIHKNT